ncbi:MAG: hypothetical protein IPK26_08055 [Planctomycetes bacterium]|nr:hypothetical protein [Planctomycetota bacterium]
MRSLVALVLVLLTPGCAGLIGTTRYVWRPEGRDLYGLGAYWQLEPDGVAVVAAQIAGNRPKRHTTDEAPVTAVPTGEVEEEGNELLFGPGVRPWSWLQVHATTGLAWGRECRQYDDLGSNLEVCTDHEFDFAWGVGAVLSWPYRNGFALEVGYDGTYEGLVLGLGMRF